MAKRDYYEVLGVSRNATADEIKNAYRQLARKHHPDISPDKKNAETQFKEINEAYAILGDPEKRSKYDRFGFEGIQVPDMTGSSPFGDFGGGFGDLFDMLFDMGGARGGGRRGGEQARPSRGRDFRYDVEITLEDAFEGKKLEIELSPEQRCPICNGRRIKPGSEYDVCAACKGTGQVRRVQRAGFMQMVQTYPCRACGGFGKIPRVPCEECKGSGKVKRKRVVTVKIPPGIEHGSRIRIADEGEAGEYGGPNGDLYIVIFIQEHTVFERKGDDLECVVRIRFTEAALGGERTIKGLDEDVNLKIPSGAQNGEIIRIKGRGMPHIHTARRGDLFCRLIVMIPTRLNEKQRKLLKEYANAGNEMVEEEEGFIKRILKAFS